MLASANPPTTSALEGRRIELRGIVQGVGMRPWIYRVAHELGVTGRVWNQASGVTVDAFGSATTLQAFVEALRVDAPPAAVIETLDTTVIPGEAAEGFSIVASSRDHERRVSIPPDLATCRECAHEILEPSNRRYRYPFTNCTNCGPRFTIALDVPYDRPATTMAPFVMCPDCQREYDDPRDRRFHAQPNACPVCGPHLTALRPDGEAIDVPDVIRHAADAIAAGQIVAVKGIGGFHLACDATSSTAVVRLRARKHRDEKPFAVLVSSTTAARTIATIDAVAQTLLESTERPIVLVPRLEHATLAPEIAPRNPLVGVMLPYTPLHHLLLADAGVPLVMTSANLSEEPIVYRNDEAIARLGDIADVLIVHDRDIVTRCDDSVATVIAGAPVLLRRSRGFVPRAIPLRMNVDVPVLACGALLKNTFCLAHGNRAWFGPHIGDLENVETFLAYGEAIERLERFVGIRGEIVAHDLHPEYLSTIYARERGGTSSIGIQHHHAHVASAVAEHGIEGPVIGVAFDGTGYATDGTSWGGEFFVGEAAALSRVATFRPLALPGGDAAIRQPWRIALGLLLDTFHDAAPLEMLSLFRGIDAAEIALLQRMIARSLNTPRARGVGRYFDAFGAILLSRPVARYEGQVAFELNMAAERRERGAYTYGVCRTEESTESAIADEGSGAAMEIDFRPVVHAAIDDLLCRVPVATIAARFHNTMIAATVATVRSAARHLGTGRQRVMLTGGCFQNALLAEGVVAALRDHDVFLQRRVPPGDGGIALGQAAIAAAMLGGS